MSEKKLDKKQNAVELTDDALENASGGYYIVNEKDGLKTLYDDSGAEIIGRFASTDHIKAYIKEKVGAGHHNFDKGLEGEYSKEDWFLRKYFYNQ